MFGGAPPVLTTGNTKNTENERRTDRVIIAQMFWYWKRPVLEDAHLQR
jgi:hypothetical protein